MDALLDVITLILGLALGSFLNVCISRLPRYRSVVTPRSSCPHCGRAIAWYDNIPVLSWILLRARCRHCGASISWRYPVVELATALLFLACRRHFPDVLLAAKFSLLAFLCIGLAFTDLESRLLPDQLTVLGMAAGLIFSLFTWVSGILPPNAQHLRSYSLANAALGALLSAGLLYLIGEAYRLARGREGMGLGDVKLAGMFGSFLGVKLALFTIFLAAASAALCGVLLIAAIYRRRSRRFSNAARARHSAVKALRTVPLPFGSFLALSAIFSSFFGAPLLDWYWNLF